MISFGQLKNNLEIIKKYLTRMQYFSLPNKQFSQKDLEESTFRIGNNQIFLPIIHYLLVQYSSELFRVILITAPNINGMNDREFIEQAFIIGRKTLMMDISLTVDQFLTSKYFQRKVQFVATLCQKVYTWDQSIKKNKDSRTIPIQDQLSQEISMSRQQPQAGYDSDESEQEAPRPIQAKPITLADSSLMKQQEVKQLKKTVPTFPRTVEFDPDQEYQRILMNRKKNSKLQRPVQNPLRLGEQAQNQNQFMRNDPVPKNLSNCPKRPDEDQSFQKYMINPQLNKIPKRPHNQSSESSSEEPEYATKEDFNKLLGFMKDISQTITNMSQKFDIFQQHVNTEIKNINAKVVMLQSKVTMISDNL